MKPLRVVKLTFRLIVWSSRSSDSRCCTSLSQSCPASNSLDLSICSNVKAKASRPLCVDRKKGFKF
eukprot:1666014-Amphidinium_carterae.2